MQCDGGGLTQESEQWNLKAKRNAKKRMLPCSGHDRKSGKKKTSKPEKKK
mgnify:CR=1 FL=1